VRCPRPTDLGCGCTYGMDDRGREVWLRECEAHKSEHAQLHEQAQTDYRRGAAIRENEDLR
jgi:hypothetical protein